MRTQSQITVVDEVPLVPVKEGVQKRVVSDSDTLSIAEYFWEKDHVTPGDHAHGWDTANYIVSGSFEVTLDGRTVVLGPGDSYTVPAGTPRTMRALEDGSYILVMARGTAPS